MFLSCRPLPLTFPEFEGGDRSVTTSETSSVRVVTRNRCVAAEVGLR